MPVDLQSYMELQQSKNLSDLSLYNTATILKMHYRYLHDAGMIETNPVLNLKVKKRSYSSFRKRPLSATQAAQLLQQPQAVKLYGKRDKALLSLLIFNGIRLIEAHRLNIEDIQEAGEVLRIQRKGHSTKDDLIKLNPNTTEAIHDYLLHRGCLADNQPLFMAHDPANKQKRLHTTGMSILIKNYLRRIGVDNKMITAHSLRHTAAHLLLLNGASQQDIQTYLGHSSFAITAHYLKYMEAERVLNLNLAQKLQNIITSKNNHPICYINTQQEEISPFAASFEVNGQHHAEPKKHPQKRPKQGSQRDTQVGGKNSKGMKL